MSAFKYCDWMKVLAASLRVGFCDHWKRAVAWSNSEARHGRFLKALFTCVVKIFFLETIVEIDDQECLRCLQYLAPLYALGSTFDVYSSVTISHACAKGNRARLDGITGQSSL